MKRRWMAAATAATLFTIASTSLAQAPGSSTKEGAERFAEGNELYTKKNYEGARLKFLQALAVDRSKGVLFNLARTEEQVGRHADAYGHYQEYLKFPDAPAKGRADAEKYSAELLKKIGRIQIGAPAGSHVQVDGKDVGVAPFAAPFPVEPGAHEATFGAESKKLDCPAGQVVAVAFEKKADPVIPLVPVPPPPKVDTPPITPPPQETKEKGSWLVPAVLGGVGVVGLGVGFGLGAASISAEKEAGTSFATCSSANAAGCASTRDAESRANGLATGAVIGQVVGIAAISGAVIATLVLRPWEEREKAHVKLVPSVGGAFLIGTF